MLIFHLHTQSACSDRCIQSDLGAQPTDTGPHVYPITTYPYLQPDPGLRPIRIAPYAQLTGTDSPVKYVGVQPTDAIAVYARYLRGKYRAGISNCLPLQWPPPPTCKVLQLAMIVEEKLRYGSPDEIIRHTLHGRVNDVLYTKKAVELKDIFKLDNAERKVILIEGAAGLGKSTLAWHICKQWQSGVLFQEFHTAVLIQLRDPAIHSATSLEHILPATMTIQSAAVVREIQANQGHGVLFVLDGWDELPMRLRTASIFELLIKNPADLWIEYSTIVITSRPAAAGNLYHRVSCRIEILGFTDTEVKAFFTEALEGDMQSVEKLQNYIKELSVIQASCYIPLNAAIVAHLFKAQNESLPNTLHEVFTSLVICCLKRDMIKKGTKGDISSLNNLPDELKHPFLDICKLAYHGVMENKAMFSTMDLQQLKLPQELNTLGLIQRCESLISHKKNISYNFLHLSVQELLASFYIYNLQGNEEIEVFKKLIRQPRFADVFRFYVAFSQLQSKDIREIVKKIVTNKEKPELVYLLHGLHEAEDDELCQFVSSHLSGELDLSSIPLSPLDCLCVGYFLRYICNTVRGKFVVNLLVCSLDCDRVSFLVKGFSKSSRYSSASKTSADAGMPSFTELELM